MLLHCSNKIFLFFYIDKIIMQMGGKGWEDWVDTNGDLYVYFAERPKGEARAPSVPLAAPMCVFVRVPIVSA